MAGAPLGLDNVLLLALNITDTLDGIHRNKQFYGGLNPAIIEVDPETWRVLLPPIGQPEKAAGYLGEPYLEYVSPEQTGRTTRTVDYRTDF